MLHLKRLTTEQISTCAEGERAVTFEVKSAPSLREQYSHWRLSGPIAQRTENCRRQKVTNAIGVLRSWPARRPPHPELL